MKKREKTWLILTLLAVLALAYSLYFLSTRFEKEEAVAVLNSDNLQASALSSLDSFYELKSGREENIYKPPWLSYTPKITYNQDGFNDRFDYEVEKPESVFRIINLGDSWAYGQYVDTAENYSERLEDYLNNRLRCEDIDKFEVLNLGVPSYDIEYTVERFRVRGAKYDPDLLLWLIIPNDFQEVNEFLKPRTAKYLSELEERRRQDEVEEKFNPFSVPPDELGNQIWKRALNELYEEWGKERVLDYQREALYSISNYFKGPLVVINFPSHDFKKEELEVLGDFREDREKTFLLEEPVNLNKDLRLPDYHPNSEGHRLIAESVFEFLLENNLPGKCRLI